MTTNATPLIPLGDLASELDVTIETIETLAGELGDSDLYDEDAGMLTPAGAEVVRDQLGSGSGLGDALADAAQAQGDYLASKERRVAAVRRARELGASWQQIADAMSLNSREHARTIAG